MIHWFQSSIHDRVNPEAFELCLFQIEEPLSRLAFILLFWRGSRCGDLQPVSDSCCLVSTCPSASMVLRAWFSHWTCLCHPCVEAELTFDPGQSSTAVRRVAEALYGHSNTGLIKEDEPSHSSSSVATGFVPQWKTASLEQCVCFVAPPPPCVLREDHHSLDASATYSSITSPLCETPV